MILIEAGQVGQKHFEAKVIFSSLLAASGHHAVIDDTSIPETLERNQQYEAARFLCQPQDIKLDHLILIGAEAVSDTILSKLRSYGFSHGAKLSAIGRFSDRQGVITSQSRIAYAVGFEPRMLDLATFMPPPLTSDFLCPPVAIKGSTRVARRRVPDVLLFLPESLLEQPLTLALLGAMNNSASYRMHVVTSGTAKEKIRESRYRDLVIFTYSELSPDAFAKMTDFAVFMGNAIPGDRFAVCALQLMRSGGVVVDCTETSAFTHSGAPALRGPADLGALAAFLDSGVLKKQCDYAAESSQSPWLNKSFIERLESALSLSHPKNPKPGTDGANPSVLFVPTNGVGLGHAQRCSVIASQMSSSSDISFAAFPSCRPLLRSKGFACAPLVQKSEFHNDVHANDILNYLRLQRVAQAGDQLVFDGGYIFDSIYRTIIEKQLRSTWIRRGLWQPGQVNETSLEREKIFDQVIVPSEAFDELNSYYSSGKHVHVVGPVVQKIDRSPADHAILRERLKAQFARDFDKLVITMLGGGVAADRSAQIQMLCAAFEHRADCLHLVVVWPNSKVQPGIYTWKNTQVVSTKNALPFCMASDLVISAVGYNSFHEFLYHGVPTIFVPQVAPYMDDQERRARAASERGYAATVMATELMMLEREVWAFLDGGKAQEIQSRLASAALPVLGNSRAAELIEGVFRHDF